MPEPDPEVLFFPVPFSFFPVPSSFVTRGMICTFSADIHVRSDSPFFSLLSTYLLLYYMYLLIIFLLFIKASLRGHSKLVQLIIDAYPEGARVMDAGVVYPLAHMTYITP